jgi:diketogulonate reductase-like aldo/keto reductase
MELRRETMSEEAADHEKQHVRLRTGALMPRVGLGVFRVGRGEVTRATVRNALALGYRHVDTAAVYGNEADVAAGLAESGLPRSDVFVTTKLWNDDQGHDAALRAFDLALSRMKLEYVDLFLLHWPVAGKRLDSWRALEKIHGEGRARAIGVSNFMVHHLQELIDGARVLPAVNQVEASPFLQQREVRALCHEHGIVVEAYSPLTKGVRLQHPAVLRVATEVGRSSAQVLLRWALQRDFVVLPKSTRPERLAENLALFDFTLSPGHLAALDALEEGLVTGWDPRRQP